MAGYSGTPLWKKLGYKADMTAYVYSAPNFYLRQLRLPADVSVKWVKHPTAGMDFVHLFTASRADLRAKLQLLRHSICAGRSGLGFVAEESFGCAERDNRRFGARDCPAARICGYKGL